MKRILLIIITLFCCLFTGCKQATSDENITELDFVALKYVDLYDYDNYVVTTHTYSLSKEELNSAILFDMSGHNQLVTVTDRDTPSDDDILILDLRAEFEDQMIFERKNHHYLLKSAEFSTAFDDKVKSIVKGKSIDFEIEYENSFEKKEFAGKRIKFYVVLKDIKRNVKITDEHIIKNYYECSTMDDVYAKLEAESNKQAVFEEIFGAIHRGSEVKGIPDTLKKYMVDSINKYELSTPENSDIFKKEMETFIYEFMLLKAIAEKEQLGFTFDDYRNEHQKIIKQNSLTEEEAAQILDRYTTCYYMLYSAVFGAITSKYHAIP